MTEDEPSTDWSDVDAEADPDQFTDYLETVTGVEAIQAYKRHSHKLLRPSEGDRILDAGCGTGDDVLMLAERVGPDGEVVGVDSSVTMVETARAECADVPHTQFRVEDVQALPFPDDHFDAARTDRVLQHLPAPLDAIEELRRVTKPGGRVGLSDSNWESIVLETGGEYSEEFLALEYASPRNPRIGRQLYGHAREVGLVDIAVDTWTPTTTDFGFVKQAGRLDTWTDAMVAAGVVTESEVEDWYAGVERADEEGRLFGALTGFTVVGTVPVTA